MLFSGIVKEQTVCKSTHGFFCLMVVIFSCMPLPHALACLAYLDRKFLGWQDTVPAFPQCRAEWDPVFTGPREPP